MMSRSNHMRRRDFLRASALAPVLAAPFPVPAWAESRSPNEKLNVAVIGASGRGGRATHVVCDENLVGLCDVDERRLARAGEKFPKAKKYVDFRKMLTEMDGQIDAVVVCTPDHTHMPAGVMAMKMGKHCFCQKPLGHNIHEVRIGTEVAKKNKLATQIGTQMHATDNYRRVVELIAAGTIGPVREVHVWCDMGYAGRIRPMPKETPPVPKHLHWDLWLGPAPYRPYHPCYCPGVWRWWWDFGNGTLGDMGCHLMDLPFWALNLRYPTTVEAEGPPVNPETVPPWLTVRYEFPARGDLPPVKLTWYDGKKKPPLLKEKNVQWSRGIYFVGGVLFVGTEGMLVADYTRRELYPKQKFADFQPPEPTIRKSIGHKQEWVAACKTGSPTTCSFDYSGPLTETVLLGNAAYRVGKKLHWDAARLKATNCPEADQFIRREYRKGWTL